MTLGLIAGVVELPQGEYTHSGGRTNILRQGKERGDALAELPLISGACGVTAVVAVLRTSSGGSLGWEMRAWLPSTALRGCPKPCV